MSTLKHSQDALVGALTNLKSQMHTQNKSTAAGHTANMSDRLIEALRASLENFSQDTRADRTEYARLRAVLVLAIAERDAGPELVTALEATKNQRKTYGPRDIMYGTEPATITAVVRYDDECGNGHNSFSITATIRAKDRRRYRHDNGFMAGGCCHEEVEKHFPELAPFIKWHLCSSDGPMHYAGNVVYLAGDRDCWGLRKGEFRQHTSRGPNQNGGKEGAPNWVLELPDRTERDVYSNEKPAPVVCEWKAYGRTGEGKARELDAARRCAIWPEATDEQLCASPEELRAMLAARLPALMAEFKAAVESLGFVY